MSPSSYMAAESELVGIRGLIVLAVRKRFTLFKQFKYG
jgi:hypothetical protein